MCHVPCQTLNIKSASLDRWIQDPDLRWSILFISHLQIPNLISAPNSIWNPPISGLQLLVFLLWLLIHYLCFISDFIISDPFNLVIDFPHASYIAFYFSDWSLYVAYSIWTSCNSRIYFSLNINLVPAHSLSSGLELSLLSISKS
jgi:hypothetical protein